MVGLFDKSWTYYTPYKNDFDALSDAGYKVFPNLADIDTSFDCVLLHASQSKLETIYLMALSRRFLSDKGVYIAAAKNDAGGKRLKGYMQHFCFQDVQDYAAKKSKTVWANVHQILLKNDTGALQAGSVQTLKTEDFLSQPGVFGWDKIDAGSKALVELLPKSFEGVGADFGCGYGYLTRQVYKRSSHLKQFYAIDLDCRSVYLCKQNNPDCDILWADILRDDLPVDLDFIVMNPPFHDGKKTQFSIGEIFIERAARSLKKNGMLYMVANTHLPYEKFLEDYFMSYEMLQQKNGFKIFKAIK